MKHFLFLGGFFPNQISEEILHYSKNNIQNAADVLQKALIAGLEYHIPNIEILNFPFLGSFPFRYKKVFIPECYLSGKAGLYKSESYVNITLLKKYFISAKIKRIVSKWCLNAPGVHTVIVYSANYLQPAVDLKKSGVSIKICLILPDLVEYMGWKDGFVYDYYKNNSIKKSYENYKLVDSFVFLSKHMNHAIEVGERPWTVVEGIYNDADDKDSHIKQPLNKYILYTGSLAYRYGIMNLVKAFFQAKLGCADLVICGSGEAANDLSELANNNKRLIFKGIVDRKEAVALQRNATLLVNPRTPEGEFTNYSFPSKIMEYFGSGVPCLMYRLPGIPDEYFKYCFTVDDLSISSLSNKLSEILSLREEQLKKKGSEAQEFIKEEKNPIKQCEKIFNLIY